MLDTGIRPDPTPDPHSSRALELEASLFERLTLANVPIDWNADTPEARGPIIHTTYQGQRPNVAGSRNGVHGAIPLLQEMRLEQSGEFNRDTFVPDLSFTASAYEFPLLDSARGVVTFDRFGQNPQKHFGSSGFTLFPTIVSTGTHLVLPEVTRAVERGLVEPDGKHLVKVPLDERVIATLEAAGMSREHIPKAHYKVAALEVAIEQVWHLPGVAERLGVPYREFRQRLIESQSQLSLVVNPEVEVFVPALPPLSILIIGDPATIPMSDRPLVVRPHDACLFSDVFGSEICSCRPYLTHALVECIRAAQDGGAGIIVYYGNEGRALGALTKLLVYRKRQTSPEGDIPDLYLDRTAQLVGYPDARLQDLMVDPLRYLGVEEVDRWLSMSSHKYDAAVRAGIQIEQRVEIPYTYLVESGADLVEIAAKVGAGYYIGDAGAEAALNELLRLQKERNGHTTSRHALRSLGDGFPLL